VFTRPAHDALRGVISRRRFGLVPVAAAGFLFSAEQTVNKDHSFIGGIITLIQRAAGLFDRIGFAWLFLALSVALLLPVGLLNPAKIGSYLWFASKLTAAAALGFGFDKAFFRGADPRYLPEGLEKSMAQQRRSVIIGCAIIGAWLIG
jgi:hypothetical protein